MAQTKRKRRNKHRGNAVGMVEARGRTSKPSPNARSSSRAVSGGARRAPVVKPPTWKSAMFKAAFGCAILFVFFGFLSDTEMSSAVAACAFAFVVYTPIMFYTDRFIYNRKTKQRT